MLQPILLLAFVTRDGVEVFFDAGGERIVDQLVEVLLEQADHGEGCPGGYERLALLPHIPAVLHRLDDRCPRTWTADAQLFQLLDQRGLGVARRRQRRVAVGCQFADRYRFTDRQCWQQRFLVVFGSVGLVAALHVDLAITSECDRGAAGRELAVCPAGARAEAN